MTNPNMARTMAPPIMEARRWLDGVAFSPDRPLIDVSQAAPLAPPPEALRAEIARVALEEPAAHLYGPVLGLPTLRDALAAQWARNYGGKVGAANVAITAGCNEAFAATIATLAGPGDEVLLPVPWYFNHKMWLDMQGIACVPVPTGPELLPDPAEIEARISTRTKALILVSPNNPGGVEYPADLLAALHRLAHKAGIALVLDETYRDFHALGGMPHALLAGRAPDDTLIQLYSFSKAYRLTGHRVGALIASTARIAQIEKFLDTVTICPAQLGQHAALWGLENLGDWLADERAEILARRGAMEAGLAGLPGWRLLGIGAYFAYVAHPFALEGAAMAHALVREAGVLALPGTMFGPAGTNHGARHLRFAFANIDRAGIEALMARLAGFEAEIGHE